MGPRPPLKRRPTYTPYTRPCKRDISAKLTPGRCKKPSYHPPCGSIYIYICMYVCIRRSIPWPRIDTSLSRASTYFDHYRLISTLCALPTPKFAPNIFGFQLFHRFVTLDPSSIHEFSTSTSPLPFPRILPCIRGRLMKPFSRKILHPIDLTPYFSHFLSVCTPSLSFRLEEGTNPRNRCVWKRLLETLRTSPLDLLSNPAIGVKLYIPKIYIFTNEGGGSTCCRVCSRYAITLDKCLTRYVSCNRLVDSTMSKLFERDGENKPSFHTLTASIRDSMGST